MTPMNDEMMHEVVGISKSLTSFLSLVSADTTSEEGLSLESSSKNATAATKAVFTSRVPLNSPSGAGAFNDWEFADLDDTDFDDDNDDGGCNTPKLAAKEREAWMKYTQQLYASSSPPSWSSSSSSSAAQLLGLLEGVDNECDMEVSERLCSSFKTV